MAITTGVGPQGESTVFYQAQPPPSSSQATCVDDAIDPSLRGLNVNQLSTAPHSGTQVAAHTTTSPIKTASLVKSASSSTMSPDQKRLAAAVAKADQSIKIVPKKRSLEDQFISTTQYVRSCIIVALVPYIRNRETLRLVRQRMESEKAEKEALRKLDAQRLRMKEFQMGLITKDQYHLLVYGGTPASSVQQQSMQSVPDGAPGRSPSPEWDIESNGEGECRLDGSDDPVDTYTWER